ncbi:unnamed protein product [Symbiodinium sp. CCMP2592]|nr:unnamed protein product [Symbiodinium sp. CCMP2592]
MSPSAPATHDEVPPRAGATLGQIVAYVGPSTTQEAMAVQLNRAAVKRLCRQRWRYKTVACMLSELTWRFNQVTCRGGCAVVLKGSLGADDAVFSEGSSEIQAEVQRQMDAMMRAQAFQLIGSPVWTNGEMGFKGFQKETMDFGIMETLEVKGLSGFQKETMDLGIMEILEARDLSGFRKVLMHAGLKGILVVSAFRGFQMGSTVVGSVGILGVSRFKGFQKKTMDVGIMEIPVVGVFRGFQKASMDIGIMEILVVIVSRGCLEMVKVEVYSIQSVVVVEQMSVVMDLQGCARGQVVLWALRTYLEHFLAVMICKDLQGSIVHSVAQPGLGPGIQGPDRAELYRAVPPFTEMLMRAPCAHPARTLRAPCATSNHELTLAPSLLSLLLFMDPSIMRPAEPAGRPPPKAKVQAAPLPNPKLLSSRAMGPPPPPPTLPPPAGPAQQYPPAPPPLEKAAPTEDTRKVHVYYSEAGPRISRGHRNDWAQQKRELKHQLEQECQQKLDALRRELGLEKDLALANFRLELQEKTMWWHDTSALLKQAKAELAESNAEKERLQAEVFDLCSTVAAKNDELRDLKKTLEIKEHQLSDFVPSQDNKKAAESPKPRRKRPLPQPLSQLLKPEEEQKKAKMEDSHQEPSGPSKLEEPKKTDTNTEPQEPSQPSKPEQEQNTDSNMEPQEPLQPSKLEEQQKKDTKRGSKQWKNRDEPKIKKEKKAKKERSDCF